MNIRTIKLILRLDNEQDFIELIMFFFNKNRSFILPIFLTWKYARVREDTPLEKEAIFDWRVVEAQDDPNKGVKELAKLHILPSPSLVSVFFEGLASTTEEDWRKVEKMAEAIIVKLQELEIKIKSVEPTKFIPQSILHPWEMIEDEGYDRQILELWHEGLTCPEIGKKLSFVSDTVNNKISKLRTKYGSKIVPYEKDRRKMRINR